MAAVLAGQGLQWWDSVAELLSLLRNVAYRLWVRVVTYGFVLAASVPARAVGPEPGASSSA